ncbi:unnamed protein product [Larinioides sclopetarius]|uniref:Uncharacterized protein n=1 Tax=Larinioides sclopetarius TaxID=280406 RepID=A0AAV2BCY2_9ARAC
MAAYTEQSVKIIAEETSNGHNIHYSFPVRSLVIRESWPLLLDYNLNCPILPTSWSLGITYKQLPETGEVSCFFTLTRTDLENVNVNATVSISLLDDRNDFVRGPISICSNQMDAYDTMQGKFESSIDPGLRSFVLSLDLFLRISLLLQSCHSTENLSEIF